MSKDKNKRVVAKRAVASGATTGKRGRFSAPRKAQAVLRLLRGEDLELLSRELGVSERKACQALRQARSTQRYKPKLADKDKPLIDDLLVLHVKHPRYGYRRITIELRKKGWFINFKRVYRLWCQEGLKVHKKQHKKLYLGGSVNIEAF